MAKQKDEKAKVIKLQIPAGQAKADPPVGPALGQHGVNIGEFIKRFNSDTSKQEQGILLPVVITVNADRSFDYVIKNPPASVLIKKALSLEKGSSKPHVDKVGKITKEQLREIAEVKIGEFNTNDIERAMAIVAGTARSMGVDVAES